MTRDSRDLFHRLSETMRAQFRTSAYIKHGGSKGSVRENALKNFLADGRLPSKYGIGSGEIIDHVNKTSPQCDLVIYDKINGVTLYADESVQIFPIENIYGIIEVKSALSKSELIDALEKIKSVKAMKPFGSVLTPVGGSLTLTHSRPSPFGMIFAYKLAKNSLDSLLANLLDWEKSNPPDLWPNYVCVLEVGALYHQGKPFQNHVTSESIGSSSWPTQFPWKEDSLFKFYMALLDVCGTMHLGPVELQHYFRPGRKIGKYFIEDFRPFTAQKTGKKVYLTEVALDKIVTACNARGPIKYGELLLKQLGQIPTGMDSPEYLDRAVFLYDPENLPGLKEIGGTDQLIEKLSSGELKSLISPVHLVINGKPYAIAVASLDETDFEEIEAE